MTARLPAEVRLQATLAELCQHLNEERRRHIRDHAMGRTVSYRGMVSALAIMVLKGDAYRVFALRQMFADSDTGDNCFPAQETLAAVLGLDVRTVKRCDKAIRDTGFMDQKRRANSNIPNSTAVYAMISPPQARQLVMSLASPEGTELSPEKRAEGTELSPEKRAEGTELSPEKRAEVTNLVDLRGQNCPPTLITYPVVVEKEHTPHEAESFSQEKEGGLAGGAGPEIVLNLIEPATQLLAVANAWNSSSNPLASKILPEQAQAFVANAVKPYAKVDASILEPAISDVLLAMAAKVTAGEVKGGTWVSACKYFTAALRGTVRERQFEAEKTRIEIEAARRSAQIRTDADSRAAEMKLGSLGKRLAAGDESHAKQMAERPASGYGTTQSRRAREEADAAPGRFPNDDRKLMDVHGCWVTSQDGNDIIEAVEGATPALVRSILKEATAPKLASDFGVKDGFGKASLKAVTDWCVSECRRQLAYAKNGTPEQLAGGPAGRIGRVEFSVQTRAFQLSAAALSDLTERYPHALSRGTADDRLGDLWRLVDTFDPATYGPERQARITAEFAEKCAEIDETERRKIAEREGREARRAQYEPETKARAVYAAGFSWQPYRDLQVSDAAVERLAERARRDRAAVVEIIDTANKRLGYPRYEIDVSSKIRDAIAFVERSLGIGDAFGGAESC